MSRYGGGNWRISDVETGFSEELDYDASGTANQPVFSSDGSSTLIPGRSARIYRCGGTDMLDGAPELAVDARATADSRFVAFTGVVFKDDAGVDIPDETSAWVAELIDGQWHARRVSAPLSTNLRAVHRAVVSQEGSRVAWLLDGSGVHFFVITADDVRDPVRFLAEGLRVRFSDDDPPSYWFASHFERVAYLSGDRSAPAHVRVLDLADPSAPALLADLSAPDGKSIDWAAWSPDGTALAYGALDPMSTTLAVDIYVTRFRDGAFEPPRLLGTTLNRVGAAFQWEP
jgi:hypothetical protein